MIAGIGLPYAYNHFAKTDPHDPPYICFLYPYSDDFVADNTNYQRVTQLVIELYSDEVDFALEGQVETVLNAAELPYRKDTEWIESERMYQTSFTTEVPLTDEPAASD